MHSLAPALGALACCALAPLPTRAAPVRPAARAIADARPSEGAPTRPAPIRPTVALLPLRVLGGPPEEAGDLEKALLEVIGALPEVALANPAEVATALKREPDCVAQIACAAAAAARAGAREFLVGTVSSLGDTYTLDLKLIDAHSGRELRRATHPVSGKEDRLLELLRATAVELLAPRRYAGKLDVQVSHDANEVARGAQLFLDGKLRGELPLKEPLTGIPPGQHTLRVAKAGFLDATLFVDVRFDEVAEARLDLADGPPPGGHPEGARDAGAKAPAETAAPKPAAPPESKAQLPPPPPFVLSTGRAPEPPPDPWLKIAGWSGVGVGVVAIATGVAFHAKAFSTASDLNQRSASNRLTAADLPAYGDIAGEMRAARFLYLVGGLAAATGATLLIFDGLQEEQLGIAVGPMPRGGGTLGLAGRF